MITVQHTKESLSCAYVQAIAAKAGLNLSAQLFDYGVDGSFHQVKKRDHRYVNSGHTIDFQLKASVNWSVNEKTGCIVYDLEVKNYEDLVERANTLYATPLILILLCLPRDSENWLNQSEDELLLRHCCYWEYISGPSTENTTTQRIEIPRTQQLTPEVVKQFFQRIMNGEPIK